jgi:hypothetical protein
VSADPLLARVRPAYGTASLADVLPGALAVLGVPGGADPLDLRGLLPGVRRVAVLLVDGLGWHQLPVAAPHAPTLADLATGRLGAARELTCGFPSTTPTSLVTLGTGAPPGAHGVLGFTVLRPETGRALNHVEWRDDPDPADWQPVPTRLQRAAAAGVAVTVVGPPEFAGTGLTVAAYRGGDYLGAAGVDALAARMLAALASGAGPALVYGYLPDLDRAGHLSGVDSPPWRVAVAGLDRLLTALLDGLPADAALLVTADHGQLDVAPDGRVDIAADPRLSAGLAAVAGEPRVRYLHAVAGAAPDVLAAWRAVLGDTAWVVCRDEAVAAGWFGPVPPAHLGRVGDVVAACRDRGAVLSTGTEAPIVGRLVAYHGSFTAVEMAIPLLVATGAAVSASGGIVGGIVGGGG